MTREMRREVLPPASANQMYILSLCRRRILSIGEYYELLCRKEKSSVAVHKGRFGYRIIPSSSCDELD